MNNKQKLELTWIGKDKQPKLEPRILIEDPEKSYGHKNTENMLIYGDNLLALKALEKEFTGNIKFIYIDPPFNTGSAFENYDDCLEHSIWLNLMKNRLDILYRLLDKSGSIMVHLDDNEVDYCKVILDELFGRDNLVNRITIDVRSPSAFSTVNPGVFKASEYILWFAKDKKFFENRSLRIPSTRNLAYNKFVKNRNKSEKDWIFISLKYAFLENLNIDRVDEIKEFLESVYSKKEEFSKRLLTEYYIDNYSYSKITKYKQVVNYLFNKLSLQTLEHFLSYTIPYLLEKSSISYNNADIDDFVYSNASAVFRETEISDDGAGQEIVRIKYISQENSDTIHKVERGEKLDTIYIKNGKQLSFFSKNVMMINNQNIATEILTNIWDDISWEGIANEGSVKFKKGKKPEKLIKRCLELSTNEGDWVLDSFLGSATTSAVSHKMKRNWIGIELGDHCHTHCIPRLQKVCDGSDQGGISESVNWKGGGGFKYYYLAPSLLKQDIYGNWVINTEYNADMLASAMAKHESFRFQPDEQIYWKQGQSTEKDFIYTTTQFVTVETLDRIHEEMKDGESLLICCKSFSKACEDRYNNITIKKIPKMLLGRCEFGKEDYSLNIINMPVDPNEPDFVPQGFNSKSSIKKKKNGKTEPDLFNDKNGGME